VRRWGRNGRSTEVLVRMKNHWQEEGRKYLMRGAGRRQCVAAIALSLTDRQTENYRIVEGEKRLDVMHNILCIAYSGGSACTPMYSLFATCTSDAMRV
jgi:hypothetical protein